MATLCVYCKLLDFKSFIGYNYIMEITIRKVANGYVVRMEGEDPVEGFVTKEYIFAKQSQVVKFIREQFKGD